MTKPHRLSARAFHAVVVGAAAVLFISSRLSMAADRAVRGVASWYGEEHRGRITASGEPFNPDDLTCASWFHRIGERLLITSGQRSVVVRVNDRGPRLDLVRRGRIIDLSEAAFRRLMDTKHGLARVAIHPVQCR